MVLPFVSDSPNRSPRPVRASAVAVSVRFSLIGSICSASAITVSNKVLNSVLTDDSSITWLLEIRSAVGSSGELNDTYLLPNTVVAWISATTLAGMNSM